MSPDFFQTLHSLSTEFFPITLFVTIALVIGFTYRILKYKPGTYSSVKFEEHFAFPRALSIFNLVFGPAIMVVAFLKIGKTDTIILAAAVSLYFAGLLSMRYFNFQYLFKKSSSILANFIAVIVGVFVIFYNHNIIIHSVSINDLGFIRFLVVYLPSLAVAVAVFTMIAIIVSPGK